MAITLLSIAVLIAGGLFIWQRVRMRRLNAMLYVKERQILALLEARTSLQQTIGELQRSDQDVDTFTYAAAHDLREPLGGILQLLSKINQEFGARLPDSINKDLNTIRKRIKRLQTLLEDLRIYSEAGRGEAKLKEIDLQQVIQQCAERRIPDSFHLDIDCNAPPFSTAQASLQAVLESLLDNAVKHHSEDHGRIVVQAHLQQEWIEISVQDDGKGIVPEMQERIFETFKKVQPRDKVEGSGLGLPLAKRLVEFAGGTLSVESTPGQGATFRFTWPLKFKSSQ